MRIAPEAEQRFIQDVYEPLKDAVWNRPGFRQWLEFSARGYIDLAVAGKVPTTLGWYDEASRILELKFKAEREIPIERWYVIFVVLYNRFSATGHLLPVEEAKSSEHPDSAAWNWFRLLSYEPKDERYCSKANFTERHLPDFKFALKQVLTQFAEEHGADSGQSRKPATTEPASPIRKRGVSLLNDGDPDAIRSKSGSESELIELFAELSPDGVPTMKLARIISDKSKSVNDRMVEASELNPVLYSKNSPWWKKLFKVSDSAITKTDFWRRIRPDFQKRTQELQKRDYGEESTEAD